MRTSWNVVEPTWKRQRPSPFLPPPHCVYEFVHITIELACACFNHVVDRAYVTNHWWWSASLWVTGLWWWSPTLDTPGVSDLDVSHVGLVHPMPRSATLIRPAISDSLSKTQ